MRITDECVPMWVVFALMVQLSPFILYAWVTLCGLWVLQPVARDSHNCLNWGGLIKRLIRLVLCMWKARESQVGDMA